MAVVLFATTFSCAKDDMARADSNCYVGTVQSQSLEVCIKEDGKFLVAGETVPNPNKASLEADIRVIETNRNYNTELEGISCKKK